MKGERLMHELSIAMSMVEIATEVATQHGVQVNAVHLKLGQLSGVVKEALLFSWDLACADTAIAGARLLIEDIPVVVYCSDCQAQRTLDSLQSFTCPVCQALTPNVVQGKELEVVALEIQE